MQSIEWLSMFFSLPYCSCFIMSIFITFSCAHFCVHRQFFRKSTAEASFRFSDVLMGNSRISQVNEQNYLRVFLRLTNDGIVLINLLKRIRFSADKKFYYDLTVKRHFLIIYQNGFCSFFSKMFFFVKRVIFGQIWCDLYSMYIEQKAKPHDFFFSNFLFLLY